MTTREHRQIGIQRHLTALLVIVGLTAGGISRAFAADDWQAEWNELQAKAKTEGRLTVSAGLSSIRHMRPVYDAFQQKFGIRVSVGGGRGRLVTSRLLSERANHLYTVDLIQVGVASVNQELLSNDVLAPIRPLLFLPEVTDESAWLDGHLWWGDPKTKNLVLFYSLPNADTGIAINTNLVKESDINSYYDVFNPRYDKLRASGQLDVAEAGEAVARMWMLAGKDWIRQWITSKPVYASDFDILVNWLISGRYGVATFLGGNADTSQIATLQKNGAPIEFLMKPMKEGVAADPGSSGNLTYVQNAPHPNASKLFVNWLLTKEGQLVYQKAYPRGDSLRIDIPKDMLDPVTRRRDGMSYRVISAEPEYQDVLKEGGAYVKELKQSVQ